MQKAEHAKWQKFYFFTNKITEKKKYKNTK